jgi:NAD-dependent deacetylase
LRQKTKDVDVLDALARDLKKSRHVVAFTGAGISSESGIPTYRGEGGLWNTYDPNRYANIAHFRQYPSYYWNFFKDVRYPVLKKAKPNRAHTCLAELEKMGKLKSMITQNIDGLHQEAGSTRVIELHGTTRIVHCVDCSQEYSFDDVFVFLEKELPPLCKKCRGMLRPAVVFFGEALDPEVLQLAYDEVNSCDFLLAVGSSLVVYPAADLPVRAKQAGAKLAIINIDPTPLDEMADFIIYGQAGRVLSDVTGLLQ